MFGWKAHMMVWAGVNVRGGRQTHAETKGEQRGHSHSLCVR